MFSTRPHFCTVEVSARHHIAEEAALVGEVLSGDFMEVEVDFATVEEGDSVEGEVQEVAAKLHGLFPIYSFRRWARTGRRDER